MIEAVTFPIYAAGGWPARISSSGWSGECVTSVTIAHTKSENADPRRERPRIEITTSTEEPAGDELRVARCTFETWIREGAIDARRSAQQSAAAITLEVRADARRRRAASLAATRSEPLIKIDGISSPFVALATPRGRWVAVRRHNDPTVTIAACDLEPETVVIEPISDPAERLLGPKVENT
jgi:hypothetical protein